MIDDRVKENGRLGVKRKYIVFSVLIICLLAIVMLSHGTRKITMQAAHTNDAVAMELSGSQARRCVQPQKNMFFLKVPKSASGTMTTILFRYVLSHNLNALIMPHHKFSLKTEMNDAMLAPKPKNESFNIFATHMTFRKNRNALNKFLPRKKLNVAIIRNPFSHFLSAMTFFQLYKKIRIRHNLSHKVDDEETLTECIKSGDGHCYMRRYDDNFISRYFGFDGSKLAESNITKFIEDTFQTFDLIIIVEYFDESLVLLKHYMCWDFKDIMYQKAHVSGVNKSDVNNRLRKNKFVTDWFDRHSAIDRFLYNESVRVFLDKINRQGHKFKDEVVAFRNALDVVKKCCNGILADERRNESCIVPFSDWNRAFRIDRDYCLFLDMKPRNIIDMTIKHQYLKYQRSIKNV